MQSLIPGSKNNARNQLFKTLFVGILLFTSLSAWAVDMREVAFNQVAHMNVLKDLDFSKNSTVPKGFFVGKFLINCKLPPIDLTDSGIENAREISGVNFTGVTNLPHATFEGKSLIYANLTGLNLKDSGIEKARDIAGVNFTGVTNLPHRIFDGKDLAEANLTGLNLKDSGIEKARNITQVNFTGVTNLPPATFAEKDLYYANLTGLNLKDSGIEKANNINSVEFTKELFSTLEVNQLETLFNKMAKLRFYQQPLFKNEFKTLITFKRELLEKLSSENPSSQSAHPNPECDSSSAHQKQIPNSGSNLSSLDQDCVGVVQNYLNLKDGLGSLPITNKALKQVNTDVLSSRALSGLIEIFAPGQSKNLKAVPIFNELVAKSKLQKFMNDLRNHDLHDQ